MWQAKEQSGSRGSGQCLRKCEDVLGSTVVRRFRLTVPRPVLRSAMVPRGIAGRTPLAPTLSLVAAGALILSLTGAGSQVAEAALYPRDGRRDMTGADIAYYTGAGVLYCRRPDGVPQKAAAAWLIGDPSLVVLNAHNFRNRRMETTRDVSDCYFQIHGRNYGFDKDSLQLGTSRDADALHITDDWALLRLSEPASDAVPQPVPDASSLPTGRAERTIVMVSPAGHENYRGPSSLETCTVHQIDPPSEDGMRRIRHDCNDGYGGSGSGLFDENGRLLAMQSASLSMNSRRAFDLEFHYGSALLFEGELVEAIHLKVRSAKIERPEVR